MFKSPQTIKVTLGCKRWSNSCSNNEKKCTKMLQMLNEKVITNTCKYPYFATLGTKTSELTCQ